MKNRIHDNTRLHRISYQVGGMDAGIVKNPDGTFTASLTIQPGICRVPTMVTAVNAILALNGLCAALGFPDYSEHYEEGDLRQRDLARQFLFAIYPAENGLILEGGAAKAVGYVRAQNEYLAMAAFIRQELARCPGDPGLEIRVALTAVARQVT